MKRIYINDLHVLVGKPNVVNGLWKIIKLHIELVDMDFKENVI